VPLTGVGAGSLVRVLRFENEDHELLRTFMREGVEPRGRYRIERHDPDETVLIALDGRSGAEPARLPRHAARTISVAVEQAGDGAPGEQDPDSLATAYLLGESHWSR
jgi:hypothetical protein